MSFFHKNPIKHEVNSACPHGYKCSGCHMHWQVGCPHGLWHLPNDKRHHQPPTLNHSLFKTQEWIDFLNSSIDTESLVERVRGSINTPTKLSELLNDTGFITEVPSPDLTGYATEEFVRGAINQIDIPVVDLSDYTTQEDVDNAIDNAIGDINSAIEAILKKIEDSEVLE